MLLTLIFIFSISGKLFAFWPEPKNSDIQRRENNATMFPTDQMSCLSDLCQLFAQPSLWTLRTDFFHSENSTGLTT
jgi:hypothetical protein